MFWGAILELSSREGMTMFIFRKTFSLKMETYIKRVHENFDSRALLSLVNSQVQKASDVIGDFPS